MQVEAAAIGAASGFVMACLAILTFTISRRSARAALTERLAVCESVCEHASRTMAEIDNELRDLNDARSAQNKELHVKIEAANAAWAIRWESGLRDFVSMDTMRAMEARLGQSLGATEGRIVEALNNLTRRVDGVMDGRGGNK